MRTPTLPILALAILAAGSGLATAADVTRVPSYDQFVLIPVRIHVLKTKDLSLANCNISDADLRKSFPNINAIWDKAGIHFGLESIVREPASQVERFKAIIQASNGEIAPDQLDVFEYLLPAESKAFAGLHVYVFHEFPYNVEYLGDDAVAVLEKPGLRAVVGGGDDHLARVIARGLGQALELVGRKGDTGLMSGGTNGIGLDESEVVRARKFARTAPGALDVGDAAKAAEAASKSGNLDRAAKLWGWLAEVPGTGKAEARKKLESLPKGTKS